MQTESQGHEHQILNDAEKSAIREQLNRLLANPFFSHSKRFPTFLRFVTEQTLAGEADNIKERTLGIEIFGRDADYDTASDPIVRVTAAEIRKRVALYYLEPEHADEMRIALPSGSYIPKFCWPDGANDPVLKELDLTAGETSVLSEAHSDSLSSRTHHHSRLTLAIACVLAGIFSVGSVLLWQAMHRSALDLFWQPVLKSKDPVLLCIADQLQYSSLVLRDAAQPTHQLVLNDKLTAIVIDDVFATVKVAGVLQSKGKQYSLKSEGATNLEDLRNGPTIFIGAFDNTWTLRLTNALRYHFANDSAMTKMSIVDSKSSTQAEWVLDRSVQMATNNYRDYAIVARFTDPNTGRLAVVMAGIARGGTIAAGEFLTDPVYLVQLKDAVKAAGDKENMEIVLSTQIIDGQPGSPKIEATYFW